jgi:hypothetical protein
MMRASAVLHLVGHAFQAAAHHDLLAQQKDL